jgi:hypothetical protein
MKHFFGKISLLLMLICMARVRSQTVVSESLYLPASGCTFSYAKTNSSTVLTFDHCYSLTLSSSSWSTCFSLCCSSSNLTSYPSLTPDALKYCQSMNEVDNAFSPLMLGLSLTLIFVVMMFFLCCVCRCYRRVETRSSIVHANTEVKTVEWVEEKGVNFKVTGKIVWSDRANCAKPLMATEQSCSICLDEGTTAELVCGHQYHPFCIGDWLSKNYVCPCCRRDIKGIKIYCNLCKWRYFVCSRTLIASGSRSLPTRC